MLKWIKWASLSITLASVIAAIYMLWQPAADLPEVAEPGSEAETGIQVDKPLLVEHEGDNVVWRLQAEKAEQNLDGSMSLTKPKLELFTESGRVMPVSGKQAEVNLLGRSITFSGDVELHFESDWMLRCETLSYDGSKDEVLVPNRFTAEGPEIMFQGGSRRIARKSQRLWVDNGVRIEDANPARWQRLP